MMPKALLVSLWRREDKGDREEEEEDKGLST
jgi:hypothetical protein